MFQINSGHWGSHEKAKGFFRTTSEPGKNVEISVFETREYLEGV